MNIIINNKFMRLLNVLVIFVYIINKFRIQYLIKY